LKSYAERLASDGMVFVLCLSIQPEMRRCNGCGYGSARALGWVQLNSL
jgi:hypothetical protein